MKCELKKKAWSCQKCENGTAKCMKCEACMNHEMCSSNYYVESIKCEVTVLSFSLHHFYFTLHILIYILQTSHFIVHILLFGLKCDV